MIQAVARFGSHFGNNFALNWRKKVLILLSTKKVENLSKRRKIGVYNNAHFINSYRNQEHAYTTIHLGRDCKTACAITSWL